MLAAHGPLTRQPTPQSPPDLRLYHGPHPLPAAHEAQSPSLERGRGDRLPAYEMKLLLDEAQAAEVEARLASLLTLDPHAGPDRAYELTTLYCDTPQWDVFRRTGRYRLFKCRLRRYGNSDRIYLERKSKRKEQVRKRRCSIELDELHRFAEPAPLAWEGTWYQSQLRRNRLQPACLIGYRRVAYFGSCSESPLRLTFDRDIWGGLTGQWSFDLPLQRRSVLVGLVVCEFKFRGRLPSVFKRVMHELQLAPQGVSKFRRCLCALGVGETGAVQHG